MEPTSEQTSRGHDLHRRLIARLLQQAEDVRRLATGLDEEKLSRRTMPGKWSLKELVCHLRRVQHVFEGRIFSMLGEENPALPPYEPEGDAEFDAMVRRPGADTLAGFLRERTLLAARLEALAPAEWHRPGHHPEYANYDVHFAVEYLAHHEAHHLYQMLQRRVPLGKLPH